MNRRKFLGHGAGAIASAAFAYPLSHMFVYVADRDNIDSDLSSEEQEQIVVQELMERYEITSLEQAKQLKQDMNRMIAKYASGGGFSGSAFRSVRNELSPETVGDRQHVFLNIVAGAGLACGVSLGARELTELTNPQKVSSNYGMPFDKAEEFTQSFKSTLSLSANLGGIGIAAFQEYHF